MIARVDMTRFPAVILSGGRSSRMGQPKALLPFGSARLIDHVADRIRPQASSVALNANDPSITLASALVFPDRFPGFHGPLAGIHAALAHVSVLEPTASHAILVPVDGPFFPHDLVERLASSIKGPDDVSLASSLGRMHPVLGLWPVTAVARLDTWLENPPNLRVRAFLDGLPVRVTEFPPVSTPLGLVDPFMNVNTSEDLERARRILDTMIS